jgi:hypothetical protein
MIAMMGSYLDRMQTIIGAHVSNMNAVRRWPSKMILSASSWLVEDKSGKPLEMITAVLIMDGSYFVILGFLAGKLLRCLHKVHAIISTGSRRY